MLSVRKKIKKNFLILIRYLVTEKNLLLTLRKGKDHSNNEYSDAADKLSKQGRQSQDPILGSIG